MFSTWTKLENFSPVYSSKQYKKTWYQEHISLFILSYNSLTYHTVSTIQITSSQYQLHKNQHQQQLSVKLKEDLISDHLDHHRASYGRGPRPLISYLSRMRERVTWLIRTASHFIHSWGFAKPSSRFFHLVSSISPFWIFILKQQHFIFHCAKQVTSHNTNIWRCI